MRALLSTTLILSVLTPTLNAQQRPSPVMEYAALLNSFDVYPDGRLQLENANEGLTTVFLPKGAAVEAVITNKGSTTPLHVQDFYVQHVTEVFARIDQRGKHKEFFFKEPGDYLLTYRTGGKVMTQVPFSVYTKSSGDEFDPKTAWYTKGPWGEWAYAYARLKDKENATLQFRMWGKRVSFDGASVTDKYTVELKHNGDVVAQSGTGYIGTQKWLKLELEMSQPASKGGRKFSVKQLGSSDGKYHFVVKKNQQLHAVYEMQIKNGEPILHARQSSQYAPRHEYMVPRYAGLSARAPTARSCG